MLLAKTLLPMHTSHEYWVLCLPLLIIIYLAHILIRRVRDSLMLRAMYEWIESIRMSITMRCIRRRRQSKSVGWHSWMWVNQRVLYLCLTLAMRHDYTAMLLYCIDFTHAKAQGTDAKIQTNDCQCYSITEIWFANRALHIAAITTRWKLQMRIHHTRICSIKVKLHIL